MSMCGARREHDSDKEELYCIFFNGLRKAETLYKVPGEELCVPRENIKTMLITILSDFVVIA